MPTSSCSNSLLLLLLLLWWQVVPITRSEVFNTVELIEAVSAPPDLAQRKRTINLRPGKYRFQDEGLHLPCVDIMAGKETVREPSERSKDDEVSQSQVLHADGSKTGVEVSGAEIEGEELRLIGHRHVGLRGPVVCTYGRGTVESIATWKSKFSPCLTVLAGNWSIDNCNLHLASTFTDQVLSALQVTGSGELSIARSSLCGNSLGKESERNMDSLWGDGFEFPSIDDLDMVGESMDEEPDIMTQDLGECVGIHVEECGSVRVTETSIQDFHIGAVLENASRLHVQSCLLQNEVCVCLHDSATLEMNGGHMTSVRGALAVLCNDTTVNLSSTNISGLLLSPSSTLPKSFVKGFIGDTSPQTMPEEAKAQLIEMQEILEVLQLPNRIPESDEARLIKLLTPLVDKNPQFEPILQDLKAPRDPRDSIQWLMDKSFLRDSPTDLSPLSLQEIPTRSLLTIQAILMSQGETFNMSMLEGSFSRPLRKDDLTRDIAKLTHLNDLQQLMHRSNRDLEASLALVSSIRGQLEAQDTQFELGAAPKREAEMYMDHRTKRPAEVWRGSHPGVPSSRPQPSGSRPGVPTSRPQAFSNLPPGWQSRKSSSTGKTYYQHSSGKTQWEFPQS